MMVCQFGGASGEGFISVADREAANTALEKKGKLENGIFTWYDENASFDAGLEDSIELMFLAKGKVTVDGKDYGPHSAFELQAKEGPIVFKAVAEAEFLRIVLPKF